MKRLLPLFVLILVIALAACTGPAANPAADTGLTYVSEFEGGQLYRVGPVAVVELKGSYRQMGRQYGALVKDDMAALYDVAFNGEYIKKQGFSYDRLKTIATHMFDTYPRRYQDILTGMAETSGLGLEKQLILNSLEFAHLFGKTFPLCSGIAVWGPYTKDGVLLFGRNNDDSEYFNDFAKYMTVAVFKANDGSLPAAIINYTGVVYAPNGMNSEGVFLELNSGDSLGFFPERTSIFVTLMSFLQDYASIPQMTAAFQSTRPNFSVIVNACDKDIAYAFEGPPEGFKRRAPDRDGLMVATNHFTDPSWKFPKVDDKTDASTFVRRDNLLALAEKNKAQFDVQKMMQVLDTRVPNGGATVPGSAYQIIAVPKDLTLWIKAQNHFGWQKANISKLLKNS